MNTAPNRLSTTDEGGKRVYVYPSSVRGIYVNRKKWVHGFLLLLFLILPWLKLEGRQLVLLDVAQREFYLFYLHFKAHDAPLLLLLFLSFAFLIGFVTAIWGRLWCGWACPQTVFTEFLFRRIETWVEGSPRDKRLLDQAPWTGDKFLKRSLKYFLYFFAALIFTHSFLAYFVGAENLIGMITHSPLQNWASFLVILVTTAIFVFDFGWFREQFCIIACPYGRLQSVMLGQQSLIVGYDSKRGEPRKGTSTLGSGDCISCNRCVQVCPTGIDIRQGLQMECVACTACIDACDEVMLKTKKPRGLIRYLTLEEWELKPSTWNIRALAYAVLLVASVGSLTFILSHKEFLEIEVLRAKGLPYEVIGESEKIVINRFQLEVSNQTDKEQSIKISPALHEVELAMAQNPTVLKPGEQKRLDFFLKAKPALLSTGSFKTNLEIQTSDQPRNIEVTLLGPRTP